MMPNARFYVRNHFPTPTLDPELYELSVTGLVERPLRLRLRDLQNMPSQSLVATLESRATAGLCSIRRLPESSGVSAQRAQPNGRACHLLRSSTGRD